MQWKIALGTEITAAVEDILAGDAATTAGKAITCALVTKAAPPGLTYACILAGGIKPIANGTVFLVKYRIKPTTPPQVLKVQVSEGIAALDQGKQLQKADIPPADGSITVR